MERYFWLEQEQDTIVQVGSAVSSRPESVWPVLSIFEHMGMTTSPVPLGNGSFAGGGQNVYLRYLHCFQAFGIKVQC